MLYVLWVLMLFYLKWFEAELETNLADYVKIISVFLCETEENWSGNLENMMKPVITVTYKNRLCSVFKNCLQILCHRNSIFYCFFVCLCTFSTIGSLHIQPQLFAFWILCVCVCGTSIQSKQ